MYIPVENAIAVSDKNKEIKKIGIRQKNVLITIAAEFDRALKEKYIFYYN